MKIIITNQIPTIDNGYPRYNEKMIEELNQLIQRSGECRNIDELKSVFADICYSTIYFKFAVNAMYIFRRGFLKEFIIII